MTHNKTLFYHRRCMYYPDDQRSNYEVSCSTSDFLSRWKITKAGRKKIKNHHTTKLDKSNTVLRVSFFVSLWTKSYESKYLKHTQLPLHWRMIFLPCINSLLSASISIYTSTLDISGLAKNLYWFAGVI